MGVDDDVVWYISHNNTEAQTKVMYIEKCWRTQQIQTKNLNLLKVETFKL